MEEHCLTDIDFERFRKLIYERSGICLNTKKKGLLHSRLIKRLQEKGFKSFKDYYQYVVNDKNEIIYLIDSISTNVSEFFREFSHFEFLKDYILPEIFLKKKHIYIWCAGCATGEEPYSLAILLLENMKDYRFKNIKILATDISTKALEIAKMGIYEEKKVKNIPLSLLKTYFQKGIGKWDGYYRVKHFVKDIVIFKWFNLMDYCSFKRPFDIIFCRNVMMYFDKKTNQKLIEYLYRYLSKGGYLFIGHSESLMNLDHKFRYIKPAIYKK